MRHPRTRTLLFSVVPVLILLLPVLVFALDAAASNGKIARNVVVAGVDVGGMSPEEAARELRRVVAARADRTVEATVGDVTFPLRPADIGYTAAVDEAVDAAMAARDRGFGGWMRSFSDPVDVPLAVEVDAERLDEILREWEDRALGEPASNGGLRLVGTRVEIEEPRDGLAVDRESAAEAIRALLTGAEIDAVDLAVVPQAPDLTVDDLRRAAAVVEEVVDAPVTLRNTTKGFSFVFEPEQIAAATRIELDPDLDPPVRITLDPAVIAELVEPRRAEFEGPPRNATYEVDRLTETVTIVRGHRGTEFRPEAVAEALLDAALTTDVGIFPMEFGPEPEITTEQLAAYGPLRKVSEFTTYHPCCANRVHNIHLMADTIDGTVVWPGEVFSVNAVVGQRTIEKGYKRDGAIIDGEVQCCDSQANIGGGVSQYGTTIYNAIFFGCYEDVEHTPHSLYIKRYPEGREATLGYPHPDVKFRNDTAYPVIIVNEYTDTSITVKFFGNNEGRECTAEKSERFNYTEPRTKYEPNPNLAPGEERVVSKGSKGWSVTVTRIIKYPDGTEKREPYTHHYRGNVRKVEVHPCMMPNADVPCPLPVPSVVGMTTAAATDALTAAGFTVVTSEVAVTDPSQDGIVQSQDPTGWADEGAPITIVVGVYTPPPEDG